MLFVLDIPRHNVTANNTLVKQNSLVFEHFLAACHKGCESCLVILLNFPFNEYNTDNYTDEKSVKFECDYCHCMCFTVK